MLVSSMSGIHAVMLTAFSRLSLQTWSEDYADLELSSIAASDY